VTVDDVEVTDAEIDEQISVMRERFGMLTGVERPAQDGDFVSIDLEAKLNGEVLEDGTTTGMSYEVGTGSSWRAWTTPSAACPPTSRSPSRPRCCSGPNAGEQADVTVTVRSVKEKDLPELDDEFASTASEFDTLAELREDVRTRLARAKAMQQGSQARDKLVEHLHRLRRGARSPTTWSSARSSGATGPSSELQQAGMDWDSFLSISGVENREAYDADQKKRSRRRCAPSSSSTRSPTPVRSPSTTRTSRRRSWPRPSAAG
jgi:FKBP-type peptidyl-prolyl cis-trans isomerase (trigger factor)